MERAIRIGKDFNVRWSIHRVVDGERQPYELAGKELVLQYRTPYGLKEATEWKVVGNTIVWTFRGKEQKALGSYELILTENGGKDGMVTVDTCRAFKLVAHSCEETEGSGGDIVIEDVVLESEVTFAALRGPQGEQGPAGPQGPQGERGPEGPQGPAGPSYNDTEIKDKLAELSEELASNGVLIEDLQNTKIEKENDDYYPKMAVGLADNLAGVDVVDSDINFRRSGGGAITDGVARIETIKGNSVVWNNLVKWRGVDNEAKGLTISYNNGLLHVSGTPTVSVVAFYSALYDDVSITDLFANGHYYAICGKSNHANITICGDVSITGNNVVARKTGDAMRLSIRVENMTIGESINESFPILICDLTKMFGSGNEPTTIEEFYARIPMGVDLNAYNEGEVIHMDVQSVESQGVNAWDEEWELGNINNGNDIADSNRIRSKNYIRVFPNKEYYVTTLASTQFNLTMYDADKQYVGVLAKANSFSHTMPSNVHYVRFAIGASSTPITTYKEGICINRYDTAINGQYFPYIKRVEDLAVIRKYFPQGMKSAGTAHDAIRYNKASGKWEKVEAAGVRAYQEGDADNAAYLTDGKVTCYPLAEPIVTELDEADQFKDLDYQVWNCGTEKAIAEGKSAPLAADITYGFNAIGKIKELENLVAALRAKVGI